MKYWITAACLAAFLFSKSQSYFYNEKFYEPGWLLEAGGRCGIMNCLTDLGGKRGKGRFIADWQNSRPAFALFIQILHRQAIGCRMQVTRGSIGAADSILGAKNRGPGSRYERNLHFQSRISEIAFLLECYPLALLSNLESTGRLQFYLLAGVGWFRYNPQALVMGSWTDLQPLHTEGQGFGENNKTTGDSYRLQQWNIPLGTGLRWEAGPYLHLRIEGIYRVLATDYLDDVSATYIDPELFHRHLPPLLAPLALVAADRRKRINRPAAPGAIRGNPLRNDAFFDLQLGLSVVLNRKKTAAF